MRSAPCCAGACWTTWVTWAARCSAWRTPTLASACGSAGAPIGCGMADCAGACCAGWRGVRLFWRRPVGALARAPAAGAADCAGACCAGSQWPRLICCQRVGPPPRVPVFWGAWGAPYRVLQCTASTRFSTGVEKSGRRLGAGLLRAPCRVMGPMGAAWSAFICGSAGARIGLRHGRNGPLQGCMAHFGAGLACFAFGSAGAPQQNLRDLVCAVVNAPTQCSTLALHRIACSSRHLR